MSSISKDVYIDKLDDILNEYSNTDRKVKINPVDVKDNTYILTLVKKIVIKILNLNRWSRISKHKNIFAKGYTPNWSEEVFVSSKFKSTVPWTYVINDLNGE